VEPVGARRAVPALTLAVGSPPAGLEGWFDLVATASEADEVVRAFARAPLAAVSAALLLRHPQQDTFAALVAESTTYSMLQAGPEFHAWRAAHPRQPAGDDDAPRVDIRREGTVTEIVLTRASRHNAVDVAMRDQLHAALVGAGAADGPILVRGDGPSFCSGGDLDEFGTFPDPVIAHVIRLQRSLAGAFDAFAGRLVVAIHGACLGAGIELPAFAGHVIAAADASIGLPEQAIGLVPGAGGTVSITRRAGSRRVLSLLLRDGTITAEEARSWGLVDEVVPGGRLRARALEVAESLV
jgi:enoyl-CoA hydratase/carnithine racemase